jgi:murein DD-endopeptidase MepM/ murein hydrolase activator NlpD
MNPFFLWSIYSNRSTLWYVLVTFILVLSLPFIAVVALTQTGIQEVSDTLVTVNPNTLAVELKNPLDGKTTIKLYGPFIWPTTGYITLEFGESDLPYQPFHTGIDIAGRMGDPISAFMKGKVLYADEISWGFGKHIIIDNGNNVTSLYGHLNDIYVKKGDEVGQGQIIGAEGSTGWSTGPHLHFETRLYGIPINPRTFLQH